MFRAYTAARPRARRFRPFQPTVRKRPARCGKCTVVAKDADFRLHFRRRFTVPLDGSRNHDRPRNARDSAATCIVLLRTFHDRKRNSNVRSRLPPSSLYRFSDRRSPMVSRGKNGYRFLFFKSFSARGRNVRVRSPALSRYVGDGGVEPTRTEYVRPSN